MRRFSELSTRAQVAAIRKVAMRAAPEFDLDAHSVRLVHHAFNTTFQFRGRDGFYAMRLNLNSKRTMEQIRGEIAWTTSLAEAGIPVPRPKSTREGEPVLAVQEDSYGLNLPTVVYQWVEGRHVPDRRPGKSVMRELGGLFRQLHAHAATFQFPPGTSRPRLNSILDGLKWVAPEEPVFLDTLDRAESALKSLSHLPQHVVHFDLHFGNMKRCDGKLLAFDFDDSVVSSPLVDVSQAIFYFRRHLDAAGDEAALWGGLQASPETLGGSRDALEALVAGRALLLVNDLLVNQTKALVELAPKYVEVTRRRLQSYWDTGYFDPSVAQLG